jgi:hypothetical protein
MIHNHSEKGQNKFYNLNDTVDKLHYLDNQHSFLDKGLHINLPNILYKNRCILYILRNSLLNISYKIDGKEGIHFHHYRI